MKTVLITGATSGIGQQMALDYVKDGWKVIACGRNPESLATLASNEHIDTLKFDLTDPQQIAEASSSLSDSLDLVILNAGTCEYIDDAMAFDTALFRRVINSNVIGTADCAAAFMPHINAGGQLAFIGSSASFLPFARAEAYGASKAAIAYFAQSLAVDLAPHNIDVSLVSPGFVSTPLTDKNDFSMPMKITVQQASDEILKGLHKRKKHIKTPRLFTSILGLLGQLPHSIQHWIALRMVKS